MLFARAGRFGISASAVRAKYGMGSIMVEDPTGSEDIAFMYTAEPILVSRIYGETDSGTVTFKLEWRAEAGAFTTGTEIHATGLAADATGEEQTSGFADPTIPADSIIALVTSATTGSPTKLLVVVE